MTMIEPLRAQVLNDECKYATPILSTDNYCSADGAFTNVGATADQPFLTNCLGFNYSNGVWFSIVPRETAILVRVFGSGQGNGNSIKSPRIAVFSDCGKFLSCSTGGTAGIEEIVLTDLIIGKNYYIMIESQVGGEGRFTLCVDDFNPVKNPESDCKKAVILCSKDPFKIPSIIGTGDDHNEIENGNCLFGGGGTEAETASTWYKWTCDKSGSLTFTLTPNDFINSNIESADLDFALYELPNGIDDCSIKKILRCMAAGEDQGTPFSSWKICNGPTGLRVGETDLAEQAGCKLKSQNNNGFVAPLDMVSGKSYVIIINNFTKNKVGFSIEFGGTGTFLGPKPDFEINANQAFECDKSVLFTNKSTAPTDSIVSYSWNFGDRAVPDRGNGVGPFNVLYQSFGDKIAALTVESSRGCTVTKIIDFFVEPCCKDTSTLSLNALVTDLKCHGIPEGIILAAGKRGAPEYKYSIDGTEFRPNPQFGNLAAGVYKIAIQDTKGCKDTIAVTVEEPPIIDVDAGSDLQIDLGDDTLIVISYTPVKPKDKIVWEPPLTRVDSIPPTYLARPVVNTSYTVTVIDSNGCTATDVVEIRVVKNLNLHAPNIFSPLNKDNSNDFFNVWVTKGVDYIELLEIYDRWGNLVYQGVDGRDFERNSFTSGWDGKFKNAPVVPGVYVWRALVKWLDGSKTNHAGDVTVYR